MADELLLRKVHSLSDLELAALLSLIAREHCLVSTAPDSVDALAEELCLIARKTFDLAPAVVSCSAHTTLDDFATALLVPSQPHPHPHPHPQQQNHQRHHVGFRSSSSSPTNIRSISPLQERVKPAGSDLQQHPHVSHHKRHAGQGSGSAGPGANGAHIANVVIARDLDRAPKAVQIQALELLRTHRIFTRTAVQAAPKQFLFMAVVGAASGGCAHVTQHLNDYLYIAHWHDPEDGFARLEEEWAPGVDNQASFQSAHHEAVNDDDDDDAVSTSSSESVVKRGSALGSSILGGRTTPLAARSPAVGGDVDDDPADEPVLSEAEISRLCQLGQQAHTDVDVMRYQMNIVAFLRMHRAVGGGVTPAATKHFEQLAKSLAPLHGLDYVTPAIVGLAARKIYLHRIRIVSPERERSMQWGSELEAIEAILDGIGPEEVLDDVLGMVGVPA